MFGIAGTNELKKKMCVFFAYQHRNKVRLRVTSAQTIVTLKYKLQIKVAISSKHIIRHRTNIGYDGNP